MQHVTTPLFSPRLMLSLHLVHASGGRVVKPENTERLLLRFALETFFNCSQNFWDPGFLLSAIQEKEAKIGIFML